MARLVPPALLLVGLLAAALPAQDEKAPDARGAAKGPDREDRKEAAGDVPGDVIVHFLNGSVVRMVIASPALDVATPYGKLTVPVKDVRAIEFGLHFPDGVAARIDRARADLASTDFRERERAARALTDLGPYSYPAVLEAARSKDLDVARRAKGLVKQLQAKHPRKDLKTSADDRVVTATFTIVGRILTPAVRARTELFGDVELSLARMRELRAVAGPTAEVEVTVDAAKYASAGQWLETAFQVDGKSAVLITARGMVDTWPQQPGQWMVGPNGIRNGVPLGQVVQIGAAGGGVVVGGGGPGQINRQLHGGALFGRVGEDGNPFLIGERFEGTPDREGKLYLHIAPSPWNCPSAGSYQVHITQKQ